MSKYTTLRVHLVGTVVQFECEDYSFSQDSSGKITKFEITNIKNYRLVNLDIDKISCVEVLG